MSYFLYAETAFHHEGDYSYLKSLVDTAANAGCKGVKFKILIDLDDFLSRRHPDYNKVKKWILSENRWEEVLEYAHSKHMRIVAMPCDVAAVQMIEKLPFAIDFYDIHSVSFYDSKLLEAIRVIGKPIILSVGGRTLEEISLAKEYFEEQISVLMVGFQAFPSDLKDVKLQKIAFLKQLFPDYLIGYADHTSYDSEYAIKSLEYGYILGARVFEKHITCAVGKHRVDYESAVGAEKFKEIEGKLGYLEKLFSDSLSVSIELSENEIKYRNRQKVLVANKDIMVGEYFTCENTKLLMTGTGDGYNKYFASGQEKAIASINCGEIILPEKVGS